MKIIILFFTLLCLYGCKDHDDCQLVTLSDGSHIIVGGGDSSNISVVPEPSTLALLAFSLILCFIIIRFMNIRKIKNITKNRLSLDQALDYYEKNGWNEVI